MLPAGVWTRCPQGSLPNPTPRDPENQGPRGSPGLRGLKLAAAGGRAGSRGERNKETGTAGGRARARPERQAPGAAGRGLGRVRGRQPRPGPPGGDAGDGTHRVLAHLAVEVLLADGHLVRVHPS